MKAIILLTIIIITLMTLSHGKPNLNKMLTCYQCVEKSNHNYCVLTGYNPLHEGGFCVDTKYHQCPYETKIAVSNATCDCPYYYTTPSCVNNPNCFWNGFGCSGVNYNK